MSYMETKKDELAGKSKEELIAMLRDIATNHSSDPVGANILLDEILIMIEQTKV
jgi:hypothetical protein